MKANDLVVTSPSTGEVIRSLDTDEVTDIERKLATSNALYQSVSGWLSDADKISILQKVQQRMQDSQLELAQLIALEGGKPLKDALVEASRAAFSVQQAIAYLMTAESHSYPINTYAPGQQHKMTVNKVPIGPAVAVSAFNHPLNLITHQAVSAFAAGCPCIIKPATDTPLSCLKLLDMFREAGMPDGWLQAVVTEDNQLAEKLVTDPSVAFFSFIGSARVGWYLRSKLAPGTRCALEHGGVAPAFVDSSANLEEAVTSLVKGAFYHAGQVCVSTQRIYIAKEIFDPFCTQFCAAVEALKVGDALHEDTDVGPLIRASEVDRVDAWVKEAIDQGAALLTGGKPLAGQFYAPTVLAKVPEQATINNAEVFGPVCNLMPFDDIAIPIAKINAEPHAFHSAIFSDSQRNIQHLFKHLHTGCLMVNEHTAYRHDGMAFAGLKQSGLGVGGMPHSIHHMQVDKMMITKQSQ